MKKQKRLLSLILAVSIVLSLAVPAFAEDNTVEYELIEYEGMDFSDAMMDRVAGPVYLYNRKLDEKIYSYCKLDSGEYALVELSTGNVIIREIEHDGRKYIPTDVVKLDGELYYLAYADEPNYSNYLSDSSSCEAVIDKNGNVIAAFDEEDIYGVFVLSKDVFLILNDDESKDCLKNIKTNQTIGISGYARVFDVNTFAEHGTYIKKSDNKFYYVSPDGTISNSGISIADNYTIKAPLDENLWGLSEIPYAAYELMQGWLDGTNAYYYSGNNDGTGCSYLGEGLFFTDKIVDRTNKTVIETKYDHVRVHGDLFIAEKDSAYGVIDRNDNIVIPFEYDYISPVDEDVYLVDRGDERFYINSKNQIVQKPASNDPDIYYDNGGEIRDGITGEFLIDCEAEGFDSLSLVGDRGPYGQYIIAEKDNKWYRVVLKTTSTPAITGVTLSDAEYIYDGTEKSLAVSGTLPQGATVSYKNEKATDVGTYNVTATVAAEGYKTLTLNAVLKINPAPVTVTGKTYAIKVGDALPSLADAYEITSGKLFGEDSFTGAVVTNANNKTEGTYKITKGTLALSANYELTFVEGSIVVSDKTPQNITVSELPAATYGDAGFTVTATPDATSQLTAFTFESSNTDVAEIAADGTVTIKAAGETDITVKQAGNDEYAPFEKTQKLTVAQKPVTIESVDLDAKTAALTGVLEADAEKVSADLGGVSLEVVSEDETTATVKVLGIALTGDKAANYKLAGAEVQTTVALDKIVTVTVSAANGTVTGGGKYLAGGTVTVTATADRGYSFSGWYIGDEKVSEAAEYSFTADADVALTAKFTKNSTGGGGGGLSAGGDKSNAGADSLGSSDTKDEDKTPAEDNTDIVPPVTDSDNTPDGFIDLGNHAWAADAINALANDGIIKGTTASTFAPAANITRADYAILLVRAFNLMSADTTNFADVNPSDYFAAELAIARNTGIVNGIGDNKFAPRSTITRQDMMVMLYRALVALGKLNDTANPVGRDDLGAPQYPDFDSVAEYAKEAVSYLIANGLVNGKNGRIAPTDYTTRAEVAVLLDRILEFVK